MRTADPVFDETGDYVARRHMTIDGVPYEAGQYVPRAAIPDHKFPVWVRCRMIVIDRTGEAKRQAIAAGRTEHRPLDAVKNGAVNGADHGPMPGAASAPVPKAMTSSTPNRRASGYLERVGRGWFNVVFPGRDVEKVRTEQAASDRLRELRGPEHAGKGITIMTAAGASDGKEKEDGMPQADESGGDGIENEPGGAPGEISPAGGEEEGEGQDSPPVAARSSENASASDNLSAASYPGGLPQGNGG